MISLGEISSANFLWTLLLFVRDGKNINGIKFQSLFLNCICLCQYLLLSYTDTLFITFNSTHSRTHTRTHTKIQTARVKPSLHTNIPQKHDEQQFLTNIYMTAKNSNKRSVMLGNM